MRRSISQTISKKETDQKLARLNQRNDEMRKELIRISSALTTKLDKKKYIAKEKP